MARANTTLVMLTLRLLIAVGCLVPFTGPRAIASAFGLAPPATALGGQLPPTPGNEEEETEREETAKEAATPRNERRIERIRSSHRLLTTTHSGKPLAIHSLAIPAPLDPFRNGLGSPYRC